LQIEQNAGVSLEFDRQPANRLNPPRVVILCAVRCIQSKHIHAGFK
jgi:hypothetical protein